MVKLTIEKPACPVGDASLGSTASAATARDSAGNIRIRFVESLGRCLRDGACLIGGAALPASVRSLLKTFGLTILTQRQCSVLATDDNSLGEGKQ